MFDTAGGYGFIADTGVAVSDSDLLGWTGSLAI
jgi:hypothetical protein